MAEMKFYPLASEAKKAASPFLAKGEEVIHCVQSYRKRDGANGECLILLTPRQLIILERGLGEPFRALSHPLEKMSALEHSSAGLGDETLILLTGDSILERVTYSSLDHDRFAEFEKILLDLKERRGVPGKIPQKESQRKVLEKKPPRLPQETAQLPEMVKPPEEEIPLERSTSIVLEKEKYFPGEEVQGTVLLSFPKERSARGFRLFVLGYEEARIRVSTGNSTVTYREKQEIINKEFVFFGEKREKSLLRNLETGLDFLLGKIAYPKLPAGRFEHPFQFTLPETALPSYKGANLFVEYHLISQVDLPLAFDLKAKVPLQVGIRPPPYPPSKGAYPPHQKKFLDHFRPDISMQVEVDGGTWAAGNRIVGRVSFQKSAPKETPQIVLWLVSRERALAKKHSRKKVKKLEKVVLPLEDPSAKKGVLDFEMTIPEGLPAPFSGKHGSFGYGIRTSMEIPWAPDVNVEVSIT